MSSFDGRAHIYLFDLKNGKKKLAYGKTPAEAIEILAQRLSSSEMDQINFESATEIHQRDVQSWVKRLG